MAAGSQARRPPRVYRRESGTQIQSEYLGAGPGNMLRFGAWIGMAALMACTGRHYYRAVLSSAIGLGDKSMRAQAWLARAWVVFVVAAIVVLTQSGLPWSFAAAGVMLVLLTFLVLSRFVGTVYCLVTQQTPASYWIF